MDSQRKASELRDTYDLATVQRVLRSRLRSDLHDILEEPLHAPFEHAWHNSTENLCLVSKAAPVVLDMAAATACATKIGASLPLHRDPSDHAQVRVNQEAFKASRSSTGNLVMPHSRKCWSCSWPFSSKDPLEPGPG